jgi:hypothetical protein
MTLCRKGLHEMTPTNSYLYSGKNRSFIQCRACLHAARCARAERIFRENTK